MIDYYSMAEGWAHNYLADTEVAAGILPGMNIAVPVVVVAEADIRTAALAVRDSVLPIYSYHAYEVAMGKHQAHHRRSPEEVAGVEQADC